MFNYSVFAAKLTVPDNLIGKRTLYLVPGSEPATAQEGQIYFNNTDNHLYYHNGTGWAIIYPGGGDKVVATRVVAAYNSSDAKLPDGSPCNVGNTTCDNPRADYTCTGLNDQATIQQAINDVSSFKRTGGVVYLLEGTYNISSSITLDSNDSGTAIIGTGAGTVLQAAANVNVINAVDVDRILISQLRIDGNNKTGSNGINFNTVTNSKINQVWIENMSQNGIYLYTLAATGSYNNIISGNNIQSNGYSGICLEASSNNIISGNNIQSNGSNGGNGIYLQKSSSGNVISSNNIQGITGGSQQNGIYLNSSSNNTISGNNIQSNGYHGIYLYSSSNSNTVSGNNSQSNSRNGIYVNSSNNNSISGNSFLTNGYRGIYIYTASSDNAVTGNVVYDNGAATNNDGMRIEDNSDNNLVSSNLLFDSAGAGRPINVASSTCDNTYLVGNLISSWPASYKEISDSGTTTRYTQKEKITIEQQTVVAPANGSTLDVTTRPEGYLPLLPTAPITLNATTAIAGDEAVAVGNLLILEGRSDTNTVTIPNNANVKLSGAPGGSAEDYGGLKAVLGLEDTLTLLWNGTDWVELAYADN